ncbi:putative transmembrane protein [Toxoplasma gondii GAB2-2007-GAL-DOM2]|uniref:Transmembrane protein n=3 Tax=Toxoplasma gondii TaxID=5811 RepID=S7V038_TOXGG|nr:hypothetical protein TGGT1_251400 [Toxoplasma gondii GT1]KAF4638817.1 hypothetical protein TGRH88_064260 [Toxoplasma gondii]KFG40804.1 putative transmembrane protein [Toxoplasma gondii GAB2-2007-GAL-DOM2]
MGFAGSPAPFERRSICGSAFVGSLSLRLSPSLSLSVLIYIFLGIILGPSQDRLAHGHIHYAPEHFDSHVLARLPEPNFCKWLEEEGHTAFGSFVGGLTTFRLLSTLCSANPVLSWTNAEQSGCRGDCADAVDLEMRRRLIRPAPARRLASSLLSESAHTRSETRWVRNRASPSSAVEAHLPGSPSSSPPSALASAAARSVASVGASSVNSEWEATEAKTQNGEGKGRRKQRNRAFSEQADERGRFASFRSFWSALVSAFLVTIATELGDRTFFLAALLSMKYSKVIVFVGTCLALFLMTAFSTGLGRLLHWAPDMPGLRARLGDFPIDAWVSCLLLLFFAFLHLKTLWEPDAASPGPSRAPSFSGNSTQRARELIASAGSSPNAVPVSGVTPPHGGGHGRQEAHEESKATRDGLKADEKDSSSRSGKKRKDAELVSLVDSGNGEGRQCPAAVAREGKTGEANRTGRRSSGGSTRPECSPLDAFSLSLAMGNSDGSLSSETGSEKSFSRASSVYTNRSSVDGGGDGKGRKEGDHLKTHNRERRPSRHDAVDESFIEAEEELQRIQYTRLGLRPSSLKILWEVFLVIGSAEVGDKSMVATVGLATAQNAFGVFVGSCLGHAGVTLLAVMAGIMLQGRLSERYMNVSCGLLFLGFGLVALFDAVMRPDSGK